MCSGLLYHLVYECPQVPSSLLNQPPMEVAMFPYPPSHPHEPPVFPYSLYPMFGDQMTMSWTYPMPMYSGSGFQPLQSAMLQSAMPNSACLFGIILIKSLHTFNGPVYSTNIIPTYPMTTTCLCT